MEEVASEIGVQLETDGWRQGSVVKDDDANKILKDLGYNQDNLVLITASQSCDISHSKEPYIEFSLGRLIETQNGNYTFNKNPRILHTSFSCQVDTLDVFESLNVELLANEKIQIPKENIKGLLPDKTRILELKQLEGFVNWLSARYSRPALPTDFNNLIAKNDPRGKHRKKAKTLNSNLSGIYVEITPNSDLNKEENYKVNLLGLVAADFEGDLKIISETVESYAEIMRNAGMDVYVQVQKEDQISIATLRRFKRFYFDDLSIKDGTPLPPIDV